IHIFAFQSCTDEVFETKTIDAGEDVTLLCNNLPLNIVFFFWMKIVPGKMPEIVGKRFSKSDTFNNTGHFTTKEEDGRFFLQISKPKPSDSGFFYCFTFKNYKMTFMKAVFLEIKGPHSDFPAVVQSSVDPVSAGDIVALQCSVLSEFKNDACPEEHRLFWFRKTEGESHPTYIYARRSSDGDCDGGTEIQPLQSCVYSFLKDVSSSDAGLYYCAVAACGKVIFGNGTKLDVQGNGNHDSRSNNIFFFLFFGNLVLSLMMVTFLICVVSKKSCAVCKVYLACKATSETVNDERQNQKINQNNVVYATAVFAKKKTDKTRGRKGAKKEETVYSDVRVFEEN
uniref:Ig-like domain-containing protein n=1 Tax=Oryzias sinensis TaxID=183150 RepID=A0A8C7Y8J1_9TELE